MLPQLSVTQDVPTNKLRTVDAIVTKTNSINGLRPLKAATVAAGLAVHQLLAINMRTNMPDLDAIGSWPLRLEQNEILLGSNIYVSHLTFAVNNICSINCTRMKQ